MSPSEGDITVISPPGRIDPKGAELLEKSVKEAFAASTEPPRLVIDFKNVAYMGSTGVRILLNAAKETKKRGGALVLCELSVPVEDVLKFAGLDSLFIIHPLREDAEKAVRGL